MRTLREELKQGLLLFDGAMGTYYTARFRRFGQSCEQACLDHPEDILAIHRAYLDAGCRCIKTNTFSLCAELEQGEEAHVYSIIDAACRLAQEAAEPYGAHVFADLGPAPADSDAAALYCRAAERFLQNGVKNFLAETMADAEGIEDLAAYLKGALPESFLLVSFAAGPEGITAAGRSAAALLRTAAKTEGVDAVGLNCMSGPGHLAAFLRGLPLEELPPFSVMPNAGYPTVLGRRTVFDGSPAYFADQMARLAAMGAAILGGCCGTTPEHLQKTAAALAGGGEKAERPPAAVHHPSKAEKNPLWEKLSHGKRVIAVELDPPADDSIEPFLAGVAQLRRAGADVVTIADCPVGRPRADSSLLACKVRRELGVEPLPHMTCRDRNLFATKALLLGLSMEGVHNVLLVTGDPIPTAERDEVKSVFNFNSRRLAAYVTMLNETTLKTPFRIFGALNVNARNFDMQLKIAREKEENGVSGFLTQPILSPQAEENLMRAREVLQGKLLGGIYPIVSHRNACFMNNEIAGIHISEEIVDRYEGKTREEAEALAVELCHEIAARITPYTDGLYLMTPFQRTALMERIIERVKTI